MWNGSVNPTLYCTRRSVSHRVKSLVPPAPSARTNTFLPGRDGLIPGSCLNASLVTPMWSAAVFDPARPGRSRSARGSPVPSGPWSTNAHNGWCPYPFLNVGSADSLSECAVIKVASRSTTIGSPGHAP